jgi:hypothetical protein
MNGVFYFLLYVTTTQALVRTNAINLALYQKNTLSKPSNVKNFENFLLLHHLHLSEEVCKVCSTSDKN